MTTESPTQQLASFASNLRAEDIPQDVFAKARTLLFDYLGYSSVAVNEDPAQRLIRFACKMGGPEEARILGTNYKVVRDIWHGEHVSPRATVMQQKTSRPVQFEITQASRDAVSDWIKEAKLGHDDYFFPSRIHDSPHIGTRQYDRIVDSWVSEIGLNPSDTVHIQCGEPRHS